MGNCANKPLTTEGEVPEPQQKPTTVEDRDTAVDLTKDEEAKKPEAEAAAKPAEEKPSEPAKIEEVVTCREVPIETKTEEAPKPVAEPPKPATEQPKPATTEPTKPAATEPYKPAATEPPKPAATEPPKPAATEPPKPAATEPPKPAASEPKKEDIKAVVAPTAAPVTVEKKVEEKKPVAK